MLISRWIGVEQPPAVVIVPATAKIIACGRLSCAASQSLDTTAITPSFSRGKKRAGLSFRSLALPAAIREPTATQVRCATAGLLRVADAGAVAEGGIRGKAAMNRAVGFRMEERGSAAGCRAAKEERLYRSPFEPSSRLSEK